MYDRVLCPGGADAGKADGGGEGSHDRSSTKVSLERYREASQEVMAIIQVMTTLGAVVTIRDHEEDEDGCCCCC